MHGESFLSVECLFDLDRYQTEEGKVGCCRDGCCCSLALDAPASRMAQHQNSFKCVLSVECLFDLEQFQTEEINQSGDGLFIAGMVVAAALPSI